jgi:hypothetical protein
LKDKLVNIEESFLFHGTTLEKIERIKKYGLLISKTEKKRVDFLCGPGSIETTIFWAQAIASNNQLGKAAIVVVNKDEAISILEAKIKLVSGKTVTLVKDTEPIDIPSTLQSFKVIGPLTPEEITEITDFKKHPITPKEIKETTRKFGGKQTNEHITLLREGKKLFEKIID